MQDLCDTLQDLVILSFSERLAPEVEQQAHNNDRSHSTQ
jgi:hypothetical protein